jgi:hypothetical protein
VISVCADTLENSLTEEKKTRTRSYMCLSEAISQGDLKKAARFNHNVGRSLALGNFVLRGLAEYELDMDDEAAEMPQSFFLGLAQGLHRNTLVCLSVCNPDQPVVLACSTANDEVGLFWTPPRE